jgi:hypothetical protein
MNDIVINDVNVKIDESNNNNTPIEVKDENVKKSRKTDTVLCEKCGFTYKRSNKTHHLRTKKHNECISRDKLKNI